MSIPSGLSQLGFKSPSGGGRNPENRDSKAPIAAVEAIPRVEGEIPKAWRISSKIGLEIPKRGGGRTTKNRERFPQAWRFLKKPSAAVEAVASKKSGFQKPKAWSLELRNGVSPKMGFQNLKNRRATLKAW